MAKDKYDRFLELTAPEKEADTMMRICSHVASGGTLIEWCKLMDTEYGYVSNWLRQDRERSRRWTECQNDRAEWFKDAAVMELRRIMTSDMRKVFDEKGNILPVHEWPDDVASFVQSLEVVEEFEGKGKSREQTGWNKKIKFWSKDKSIETMMKHLGILVQTVTHNGKITLEELINASREDDEDEQQ